MPIGVPAPVQDLITAFERLPGIGPKTASRLAFYLLRAPEKSRNLAEALIGLKSAIQLLPGVLQHHPGQQQLCDICANPKRDGSWPSVVEEPLDVLVLEQHRRLSRPLSCAAWRAFAHRGHRPG